VSGRVLLVDGDAERAALLAGVIAQEGLFVIRADGTHTAIREAERTVFDLLVWVGAAPDGEHMRRFRTLRVRGLLHLPSSGDGQAGATMRTLRDVARHTHARVRRPCVRIGNLDLDPATRALRHDGAPVDAPPALFELLYVLASEPERTVSHEGLHRTLADVGVTLSSGRLPRHVAALRALLRGLGTSGVRVQTRRGAGYRLTALPSSYASESDDG
jgi:DNA-binding response OmpR family regulator